MNTIEITGTRNNKEITLTVEVGYCQGVPTWVRKENGKPLFGSTGYLTKFNGLVSIQTYRSKLILDNVSGIDASKLTEQNRDLWVDGKPPASKVLRNEYS